jgi:hypothetical protein
LFNKFANAGSMKGSDCGSGSGMRMLCHNEHKLTTVVRAFGHVLGYDHRHITKPYVVVIRFNYLTTVPTQWSMNLSGDHGVYS